MRTSNGFFGWKVVWVAFLVAVFAWGVAFYGPAVFLQTLHATRNWPISTISAAITVHFFFSAIVVTYLPEIHRRLGIAWATCAGAMAAVSRGGTDRCRLRSNERCGNQCHCRTLVRP